MPKRTPLNRERVLRAAVALADEAGIDALSMRRLGQELGVEAMSLYNHVANKDDLLNGITDLVLGEIELPRGGELEGRPAPARDLRPRRPRRPSLGVQARAVAGSDLERLACSGRSGCSGSCARAASRPR